MSFITHFVCTVFDFKSIVHLSQTGSVSIVFSTDPLEPVGVCQALDDQLLVTLSDTDSDNFELDSCSKRLVRHVTLTGDVILEYTYQEKCQIKQFTWPFRVTQNGNSDVCLLNNVSKSNGELLIFSFSGFLKSAYRGRLEPGIFLPEDVVCDLSFALLCVRVKTVLFIFCHLAGSFWGTFLQINKSISQQPCLLRIQLFGLVTSMDLLKLLSTNHNKGWRWNNIHSFAYFHDWWLDEIACTNVRW